MKYFSYILALILLAGCFGRQALMTQVQFDSIELGTSIADVTSEVGDPYSIRSKGPNTKEYEYIEKINMGNDVLENHYYLIITDGQVMGKWERQEQSPAYDLIYQDDPNVFSY